MLIVAIGQHLSLLDWVCHDLGKPFDVGCRCVVPRILDRPERQVLVATPPDRAHREPVGTKSSTRLLLLLQALQLLQEGPLFGGRKQEKIVRVTVKTEIAKLAGSVHPGVGTVVFADTVHGGSEGECARIRRRCWCWLMVSECMTEERRPIIVSIVLS